MYKETGANHKVAPVSFFYLHLSLKQKFPHCHRHDENTSLFLGSVLHPNLLFLVSSPGVLGHYTH